MYGFCKLISVLQSLNMAEVGHPPVDVFQIEHLEDGVHPLAWLTPCGKEIDQDQLVALMHEEFAFGNADGFHEVGVSTEPDACAALLKIIA